MTEQPLVVIVVVGEQVVVEIVELPVVKVVGTHRTVTRNAVSMDAHDEDELVLELVEVSVDESELVLLFELLSFSSSVRFSFSVFRSSRVLSMLLTSSVLISSVRLSKFSSMQDNVLTMSPTRPRRPLFFFEMHGLDDGSLPRSEMRPSTSLLISLTLLRVSVLSGVGFARQELMIGIKPTIWEDTDDTADVA